MELAYDIEQSYEVNYERGPKLGAVGKPVPTTPLKDFLGYRVSSRLGVAAGLLLNSRWIGAYGERGFDLLTYKTVRSVYRPPYPPPNWVFVEPVDAEQVREARMRPNNLSQVSSSVCFGMPSMGPDVWRKDIAEARKRLKTGQILIVSVVGTPGESMSEAELAADFQRCASWAVEAGAQVIEANFSCPNVCSAEGDIYHDPGLSKRLAIKIREAIGETPLLLKIGEIKETELARRLLCNVGGIANGITLVNCLVAEVLKEDGKPVFGEKFRRAGVLGRMIHDRSVKLVEMVREIVEKEKMDLAIAAVGGASTISDIEEFFSSGADAVLFGSSPMYQPDLAIEAKARNPLW